MPWKQKVSCKSSACFVRKAYVFILEQHRGDTDVIVSIQHNSKTLTCRVVLALLERLVVSGLSLVSSDG